MTESTGHRGLYFESRVTLGNVIQIILLAVAIVMGWANLQYGIERNNEKITFINEKIKGHTVDGHPMRVENDITEVRGELREIRTLVIELKDQIVEMRRRSEVSPSPFDYQNPAKLNGG